jgi:hypothetical protein
MLFVIYFHLNYFLHLFFISFIIFFCFSLSAVSKLYRVLSFLLLIEFFPHRLITLYLFHSITYQITFKDFSFNLFISCFINLFLSVLFLSYQCLSKFFFDAFHCLSCSLFHFRLFLSYFFVSNYLFI